MRGNTHSDTRETFSHRRARRQLAVSQPSISSEDLLVVGPPNLIIVFSIALSSRTRATTNRGGEGKKRDREKEKGNSDLHASWKLIWHLIIMCDSLLCLTVK